MAVSLTKAPAAHAGTFVTARTAKRRAMASSVMGALAANHADLFPYAVRMRDTATTHYARY